MKEISNQTEEQLRKLLPIVLEVIPPSTSTKVQNAVRRLKMIVKQLDKRINNMEQLEIGKEYVVTHSRKGVFTLKVTSQNEDSVTGEITKGKTKTCLSYNSREVGEIESVRRCLCKFKAVRKEEVVIPIN